MTQPNLFNQSPDPTETEIQAKRMEAETQRKRDYQIWIDSLSADELKDYKFAFNEL